MKDPVHRRRLSLAALALLVVGVAASVLVVALPAQAATQLPAPGAPVATTVTETSISISWTPSSGPVASYTVDVIDQTGGTYHPVGTVSTTTFSQTGLTPDHNYVYEVIANPTSGSGYTASNPSPYTYVTTLPVPETIPPTQPGTPTVSSVTTVGATLSYAASTDDDRVSDYIGQLLINGVWTDNSTNNNTSLYLTNLTPATTYTAAVVAIDPSGNRSPRSNSVTFTTLPAAPFPTCRAAIVDYGTQYTLSLIIANMTVSTPLTNWTVTFTLPSAQTVNSIFNGSVARSGDNATVTPAFYYASVGSGGTATIGLNVTRPAGSPLPSNFVLHGQANYACTS
jgi:hypothetical protein